MSFRSMVMAAAGVMALSAGTAQAASVIETLQADGRFTRFLQMAQGSSIWSLLQSDGPITVFAPTDEAFGYLPAQVLVNILPQDASGGASAAQTGGPITRDAVATFHVVRGDIRSQSLVGGKHAITTVNGKELEADGTREGYLTLTTARPGLPTGGGSVNAMAVQPPSYITQRDIRADNGTIQVINTVLLP